MRAAAFSEAPPRKDGGDADPSIPTHEAVFSGSGDRCGRLRGAVNRNAFDRREELPASVVVSPQQLAPDAKLARWSQLRTPAEFV